MGEGDYYDEACELHVLVCRDEIARSTRDLEAIGIYMEADNRGDHATTLRLDPDQFFLHYFSAQAGSLPDNKETASKDLAAVQHKFDAQRQRDLGWIRP